jgi:hypothetical protein
MTLGQAKRGRASLKINKIGRGFVGSISVGRHLIINGFSFSTKDSSFSSGDKGESVSERRSVETFEDIVSTAAADVDLSFGEAFSVTVEGSAKAVSSTLTEVKRGVLSISTNASFVNERVTVVVKMAGPLNKLKLKGAGDTEIDGMNQELFTAVLSGVGDLDVSGKVEVAVFCLTGTGDVDASSLDAESVEIESSGVGNVKARATRRVIVDASGVGNVSVKGGATDVTSKSRGVGDVKIR